MAQYPLWEGAVLIAESDILPTTLRLVAPAPYVSYVRTADACQGWPMAARSVWSRVDMRSAHPRFNIPSRNFWPYLSRPEAVWAEIWLIVKLRMRRFIAHLYSPRELR